MTGFSVTMYECNSCFSRKKKGKIFFDKEKCFIVQFSHTFNDPSAHFLSLRKRIM